MIDPLFTSDATWQKSPKTKCTLTLLRFLNAFGIGYCIVVLTLIFGTNMVTTMPYVYKSFPEMLPVRQLIGWFLCINIITNYVLTTVYNSYYVPNKNLNFGLVDSNWRQCLDCKHLIPPRAHHCSLCKGCILKRDHHCFFTGSCIGFYNQRFFICFLFYVMLGCAYGFYLTFKYVQSEYSTMYEGLRWYGYLYHFFLPVTIGEWVSGYLDSHETYYILLGYLTFASGLGATIAFNIEMYLICRGMTAYEMNSGSLLKGKSRISDNLKGVFGNYWFLNFLFPLPWIKPKGNGIDWYSTTKYI